MKKQLPDNIEISMVYKPSIMGDAPFGVQTCVDCSDTDETQGSSEMAWFKTQAEQLAYYQDQLKELAVDVESTKQQQAVEVAKVMKEMALLANKATRLMYDYDLNLENYPEYWLDFDEHSQELMNIFVADFNGDTQVQVGEV